MDQVWNKKLIFLPLVCLQLRVFGTIVCMTYVSSLPIIRKVMMCQDWLWLESFLGTFFMAGRSFCKPRTVFSIDTSILVSDQDDHLSCHCILYLLINHLHYCTQLMIYLSYELHLSRRKSLFVVKMIWRLLIGHYKQWLPNSFHQQEHYHIDFDQTFSPKIMGCKVISVHVIELYFVLS